VNAASIFVFCGQRLRAERKVAAIWSILQVLRKIFDLIVSAQELISLQSPAFTLGPLLFG
jgi:hypothetical protein